MSIQPALTGKITSPPPWESNPLTDEEKLFAYKLSTYDDSGGWCDPVVAYREVFGAYTGTDIVFDANKLANKENIKGYVEHLRGKAASNLLTEVSASGIAVKGLRIRRMNSDWLKLQYIKEERARAAQRLQDKIERMMKEVESEEDPVKRNSTLREIEELMEDLPPGMTTGLLVLQKKMLGQGDYSRVITEAKVDVALLDAQMKLEERASEELGQKTTKSEVNLNIKGYVGFDPNNV